MTSPLFRHVVQCQHTPGAWARSVWDISCDGTFDSAAAECADGQWLAGGSSVFRVMTVLVPPVYEIQRRDWTGRWHGSWHNELHDGSWLGVTRAFQMTCGANLYRVVQVDA